MYGQGVDIIYHAAGGTGNGVFTEAKNRKKKGENVWVIGVDRDQDEEGMPENVTLTSMVKRVDIAVQDVAKEQKMENSQVVKLKSLWFKRRWCWYCNTTTDNVTEVNA